ncbi:hypothetical protein [Rubrivirga sp.]|uniref:hypothetical protein n=1 Tax=Rubrivirga sp. TaxID=1885344 RepID=UPI003C713A7A
MPRLSIAICALAWAIAPSAQPATYDADLVRAFFGLDGSETLTAAAPDSLRSLLPPGAQVIGTRTFSGPLGGALVVARLGDAAEVAQLMYREMDTPGWVPPAPKEPDSYLEGGFTTDFPRDTTTLNLEAETSEATARITFADFPRGGSYVRVRVYPRDPVDVYNERNARLNPPPPSREQDRFDPHLPLMTAPPGGLQTATGGGGGGGSGSNHYTARANLESDLLPAAVSAHYAAQMADAGWASAGDYASDTLATSSWTREGDDGPLAALLYIRALEDGSYALRAHVLVAR